MKLTRVLLLELLGIGLATLLVIPTAIGSVTFDSNNSYVEVRGGVIDDYGDYVESPYYDIQTISDTTLPLDRTAGLYGWADLEYGSSDAQAGLSLSVATVGESTMIEGNIWASAGSDWVSGGDVMAEAYAHIELLFSVAETHSFEFQAYDKEAYSTYYGLHTGDRYGSCVFCDRSSYIEDTIVIGMLDPGSYLLYVTVTAESLNDDYEYPVDGGVRMSMVLTPAPIPIPAAVWLFSSALAGIGFLTRRRKGVDETNTGTLITKSCLCT